MRFVRHLATGRDDTGKTDSTLFKDPTVNMMLHLEYRAVVILAGGYSRHGITGHIWLRFDRAGPGCRAVCLQAYGENGRNILRYSPATTISGN